MKKDNDYVELQEFILECKVAREKFLIQYYQNRDTKEFEQATEDFLLLINQLIAYTEN